MRVLVSNQGIDVSVLEAQMARGMADLGAAPPPPPPPPPPAPHQWGQQGYPLDPSPVSSLFDSVKLQPFCDWRRIAPVQRKPRGVKVYVGSSTSAPRGPPPAGIVVSGRNPRGVLIKCGPSDRIAVLSGACLSRVVLYSVKTSFDWLNNARLHVFLTGDLKLEPDAGFPLQFVTPNSTFYSVPVLCVNA